MYCCIKGCYNELWADEDNPFGLCKEHYDEAQKKIAQTDIKTLYEANEKRLKELEQKMASDKK